MRKFQVILVLVSLTACHARNAAPDVSAIPMEVKIERFDKAWFALDSNHIKEGLLDLNRQFPYFLGDFSVNILGAGPLSDTSETAFAICRRFLTGYQPVKDSIGLAFADLSQTEIGLKEAFRYIRYYFPDYKLPPKLVSYIGPFDAPGAALTRFTLAIGLQLYAGRKFSFYQSPQGQELFPIYISRRFEPEYITTNCVKALVEDIYPDQAAGKPLIDEMVEKGKAWFLLDRILPETTDSLKTGFTRKQLDWCTANEGQIWNFFLQTDVYTIDPELIKIYIGDGPNTQGLPDGSPGNIGQWVGWRIVNKFAAAHPDVKPAALLAIPARKIFEESGYKPR